MLKSEKIAVIILNWNNAPDTLECLESVYQSDDPLYEVYIVDNGSKDASLSIIQKAYPQAHYIPLDANYGFAEGNNRAIKQAIKEGAAYLFLLNNDATIRKDTLSLLRDAAERFPNACALGPKIFHYDMPMVIYSAGGQWDPINNGCPFDWGRDEADATIRTISKIGYVCGCALFARVSLLERVGLMDERFFLNCEEVDWCFQMRKKGFDCLIVPEAKAWHKISRSFVGGKKGPMWTYFSTRNRLLWMEKNLSLLERLRIAKRSLWPEFWILWKNRKDEVSRAALIGIRDYFLRRFGLGSMKAVVSGF